MSSARRDRRASGAWSDLDTQSFASIRSPHPHGAAAEGTDVRKIDAFAHILPPSYARRLESIMSGPVSDRVLGYQPWIHEDPVLTSLDARWRVMDAFDDYVQVLTLAVPPPGAALLTATWSFPVCARTAPDKVAASWPALIS